MCHHLNLSASEWNVGIFAVLINTVANCWHNFCLAFSWVYFNAHVGAISCITCRIREKLIIRYLHYFCLIFFLPSLQMQPLLALTFRMQHSWFRALQVFLQPPPVVVYTSFCPVRPLEWAMGVYKTWKLQEIISIFFHKSYTFLRILLKRERLPQWQHMKWQKLLRSFQNEFLTLIFIEEHQNCNKFNTILLQVFITKLCLHEWRKTKPVSQIKSISIKYS